jgi:hypothetical protein
MLATVLLAASGIFADAKSHSVTFTATATGIEKNTIVEFLLVGPESDRDYESVFVTDASAREIADEFERAGIPCGGAVDLGLCRFWPTGKHVSVKPDIWQYVSDAEGETAHLPATYTGGRDMPCAILALYNCPQSLMQLDDSLDQSDTYERFKAAVALEKGTKVSFTVSWDGVDGIKPYSLRLTPGGFISALEDMRKVIPAEGGLDVSPDFAPELTVGEATAIAASLAMLDLRQVRIGGYAEGQMFYRAFLPLEEWRNRKDRLTQPLEIALSETNAVYTIIDEDWSGEGMDPVLKPRTVGLDDAMGANADTCFIFAPKMMKLERIYEIKAAFPKRIRNWYIYGE